MCLLITAIAAVISTVLWYFNSKRKAYKLSALCFMYWGASIMWFVDFVFEYSQLKADYFNQPFAEILNDSLLGLSVVVLGLIVWVIILLIKDPKVVFKKAFN